MQDGQFQQGNNGILLVLVWEDSFDNAVTK